MTSQKILQFLRYRDQAIARRDWGLHRSLTADLRRWGVPDDATFVHPSGKPVHASMQPEETAAVAVTDEEAQRSKGGRPRLPRCEHGNVTDRCEFCNPELAAK